MARLLEVPAEWLTVGDNPPTWAGAPTIESPPTPIPSDTAAAILSELRALRADIAMLLRSAASAGDKDILNLLDRRDAPQEDARQIAEPRGSHGDR